jgi:polar amino acid transport system permease protein
MRIRHDIELVSDAVSRADQAPPADQTPPLAPGAVPIVRPARRYGIVSIVWAAAVICIAVAILITAITDKAFEWPIFAAYFFALPVLLGVEMTLVLTVLSGFVAVVLGTVLAIMRMSSNPILSAASAFYSWLFRGIPVLVQLIFWYNLALLFPSISLGIPGVWSLFDLPTNVLVTPFIAAVLGLGLSSRIYGRSGARRHHLGGFGPDRGDQIVGHDAGPGNAADNIAAGDAGGVAAGRQ